MNPIPLRRLPLYLRPTPSRVLVRPFLPAPEPRSINPTDAPRALKILTRILSLSDEEVAGLLEQVMRDFGERHIEIQAIFLSHFARVQQYLTTDRPVSEARRLLIGAYFTHEYSLESAALFNPSIVPHPDQSGVAEGSVRVILSLRATGEGHISSITFRSGVVESNGNIEIDPPSPLVAPPRPIPSAQYERVLFRRKLGELGVDNTFSRQVLETLEDCFTLDQLRSAIGIQRRYRAEPEIVPTADRMILLARANYDIEFDPGQSVSARIVFPFSPSESNGIEDARFVRFQEGDGSFTYFATYTAYDGRVILPQLLETRDFLRFNIRTLNGPAVQNKGMALFPRRIRGHYCMLSRQDNENIHIMFSDHLHFWYESRVILRPTESWEFIQLGNCGSPMETDAGWLVLTHGVGPMRKYCIGAILLDREDPSRVIGRLREPLIKPVAEERDGYVPNVVYTCGAMIHAGHLIIPYAISDSATTFATVPLDVLLAAMSA